jgi:NAD-dependent dihydropyrimidine dehydrogenase PreA subunit
MPVARIHGCIGCKACVEVCPTDVLRMDPSTGHAVIAHQLDCQICHLCRLYCPVDAIELTPDHSQPISVAWG